MSVLVKLSFKTRDGGELSGSSPQVQVPQIAVNWGVQAPGCSPKPLRAVPHVTQALTWG